MPFFSSNGQQIYFEDSGSGALALVMMHGFLLDQSLFDHQVSRLSSRYRCIRFDARAFGNTKWDEKPFTLYDTVSDCIDLLDHLAIPKAVIVGMSQGGYAALRLAIKHPTRVHGLVLMSTQAAVDGPETIAQFTHMRDAWVNDGPIDPLLGGLATALLGPNNTPQMETIWRYWLPKWRALTGNAIFHGMNNLLTRDDITNDIADIHTPALVTHGDADIGMPLFLGQSLSNNLGNCKEFLVVKEAAHAANFTHPEPINHAMEKFLDYIIQDEAQNRNILPSRQVYR